MIRQSIVLPEWGWRVHVYYMVDSFFTDEVIGEMADLGASESDLERASDNLRSDLYNTGLTYSSPEDRTSVVVIGKTRSSDEFSDTFDHEKGHVVKHISKCDGIDPYSEEAEYIAGTLSRLLFPVAQIFLCDKCRQTYFH